MGKYGSQKNGLTFVKRRELSQRNEGKMHFTEEQKQGKISFNFEDGTGGFYAYLPHFNGGKTFERLHAKP